MSHIGGMSSCKVVFLLLKINLFFFWNKVMIDPFIIIKGFMCYCMTIIIFIYIFNTNYIVAYLMMHDTCGTRSTIWGQLTRDMIHVFKTLQNCGEIVSHMSWEVWDSIKHLYCSHLFMGLPTPSHIWAQWYGTKRIAEYYKIWRLNCLISFGIERAILLASIKWWAGDSSAPSNLVLLQAFRFKPAVSLLAIWSYFNLRNLVILW